MLGQVLGLGVKVLTHSGFPEWLPSPASSPGSEPSNTAVAEILLGRSVPARPLWSPDEAFGSRPALGLQGRTL